MRTIAVVPARGGSKGFPGKNLAHFHGRPLVAHAVATGFAAGIDTVLLTTDDEAIAAAGREAGARVVHRPADLATDTSRTVDAVLHAIDETTTPDEALVVLLQPTSPLRTPGDVAECLRLHGDRPTGSVVQMAASAGHHPLKACLSVAGRVVPVGTWPDLEAPRQELPPVLRPTGGVYVVRAGDLRAHRRFFVPEVVAQLVPEDRALDVDTEADLVLARQRAGLPG
jgi:N-acylneuraminate cytidylyltransferase